MLRRFTVPRDIFFGKGSLENLKLLGGKKAMVVVGGGSMKRLGFLDKIVGYLKEGGMEVELIEGVEPDPSVETVMKGAEAMRKFEPDWIVAVGGGSPIDAAKAMWIFYEHPETKFENILEPFTLPQLRTKAHFVAIPSTSGTASEVTACSVITDYSTEIKFPLADYTLTPDIAILDSELAEAMPKTLTAHTGMDALTHAIEAYVALLQSPFSNPYAIEAIKMINENLVKSYETGDPEAREQIHYAQCLAGMAFSHSLLGIAHSMAHKIGAVFHIAHGHANAIFLPYVIQFNATVCADRYATIAKAMGLEGNSDQELVDKLCETITELNKKLGIELTLKELGIDKEEFDAKLQTISENTLLDPCTFSNPRQEVTAEEVAKLFTCTYNGDKVTF